MGPPVSLVMACVVMVAICAICPNVGWIGITKHQLTTGEKLDISTYYGLSAVVSGLFFIAAAFDVIGFWRRVLALEMLSGLAC